MSLFQKVLVSLSLILVLAPSVPEEVELPAGERLFEPPTPSVPGSAGSLSGGGAPAPPPMKFWKGELARLGVVRVDTFGTSIGARLGVSTIEDRYYLNVDPGFRYKDERLAVEVSAPLRFQIADLSLATQGAAFQEAGAFLVDDWNEFQDILKPLRRLTYGRKEDRVFLDLNRAPSVTLGHGQLMRRYSTADIGRDQLFAETDAYFDLGGVELVGGPLPVPRVVGGLAFLKPLGWIDHWMAKSLSFGITYVADLNATSQLTTTENLADGRSQIPVLDNGTLLAPGHDRAFHHVVQGYGVDVELKVVKTESVDVKVYGDYSRLQFPDAPEAEMDSFGGGGFALGALFRLNFGQQMLVDGRSIFEEDRTVEQDRVSDEPVLVQNENVQFVPAHAIRLRVEGRTFGPQFLPSYFDTLYEADKQQFTRGSSAIARTDLPTKWRALHDNRGEADRVGGYLGLSYLSPGSLAVMVTYEDALDGATRALSGINGATRGVPEARNLALHIETHQVRGFNFFASYHYRHFSDFGTLLSFTSDNELFYLGTEIRPFPWLSMTLASQRSFRTGFSVDDLPRQRFRIDEPEFKGELRRSSFGLVNGWSTEINVELGWSY